MTTRDPGTPLQVARRLRFDRYILDFDRGFLLFDGSEITLRPKTLRYCAPQRPLAVDMHNAINWLEPDD
jgi:hypothetical protein